MHSEFTNFKNFYSDTCRIILLKFMVQLPCLAFPREFFIHQHHFTESFSAINIISPHLAFMPNQYLCVNLWTKLTITHLLTWQLVVCHENVHFFRRRNLCYLPHVNFKFGATSRSCSNFWTIFLYRPRLPKRPTDSLYGVLFSLFTFNNQRGFLKWINYSF